MTNLRLAVIGSGVVGVTTALELQKNYPTADVTIFAEKFNRDTTSDGAAGIFRPGTSFSASSEEITRKIIRDSFEYFDEIKRQNDPWVTGVLERSGYIFSSTNPSLVRNHLIEKIVPVYRKATEEELKICPGEWKYGSYFTTLLTECRRYLPWSLLRFQKNNGKVVTKTIAKLSDLGDGFDIIVNCTGFGAKYLFNDHKMVPIRGQVLKVSYSSLKNFFYADYDTYIIPGLELTTLGGCRNYDSYDTTISRHDTAGIWERCTELVPGLKTCKIEREWVGLRPHRDPVRIETEIIKENGKIYKIVHNYGHGGYGVTTAPGSAKEAVSLTKQLLMSNSKL